MALYHFHRVLIAAAIVFFVGFSWYAFRQYTVFGAGRYLFMAIGSACAGVALLSYFIYFHITLRNMKAKAEPS